MGLSESKREFQGSCLEDYLKNADAEWYRSRLAWSMYCVMAAFALLTVRLYYLQVIEGEEFRRLSENNCIRLQSIDPSRGLIFDRNGTLLVDNRPSFDITITLRDARPVVETVTKLAGYTGIPLEELLETINKNKRFPSYKPLLLRRDIGRDALAAIEVHEFDLPGIEVDVKPLRQYINGRSAAHLLGYLGEVSTEDLKGGKYPGVKGGDAIGKFGVEKIAEQRLRGKRGGRQVEVDARGQVVRVLKTVPARPGNNLVLTIDQTLQEKAEALLVGKVGGVVALEPSSGQILCMASSPTFDQNAFVGGISRKDWRTLITNPDNPMSNKAIQGEYPPASTYKIITAIAGLEEGIVDEETTTFCPGFYKYGDRVFRCWRKYGHGKVNVVEALEKSCDVYFYQVGQKLGVDRLAWYARACGMGTVTGIELANEASGLIPTAAWKKKRTGVSWQGGETLSIAIGQGYNLATPLQVLSLYAAVGTGGERYRPTIVKAVKTAEGEVVEEAEKVLVGKLPVSKKNLAIVRQGLWNVVQGKRGTARLVRLKEIDVSGKTGTAQVYSRKKNEKDDEKNRADHLKPHAWFTAYAPSENPAIAVSVMIEHGEHGSSGAGPVAKELIKTYLGVE